MPEILTKELVVAATSEVSKTLVMWTNKTTDAVEKKLNELDQRSKDVQSFVIRHVGKPTSPTNE